MKSHVLSSTIQILLTRFGGQILIPFAAAAECAGYRRESECRLWMHINEPQRSWLAVDDLAVFFTPFSPALHLIDRKTGLTDADVAAIIQRIESET